MGNKIFTKNNFVIISSIFAALSIILFFFAETQKDKAEFILISRAELIDTIQYQFAESDNSLLLYKVSNDEDTQELILAANKTLKAKDNFNILQQLYPKYVYYKKLENVYRYFGLAFITLSIACNAIALLKKK